MMTSTTSLALLHSAPSAGPLIKGKNSVSRYPTPHSGGHLNQSEQSPDLSSGRFGST